MIKNISSVIRLLRKQQGISMLGQFSKNSPFYILISTILSARNRDEMTIIAAKTLFAKYKTPTQLASAPLKDVEKRIKKSGFYKTKARRVKEVSKILLDKYNGNVPDTMEELVSLPGVGRKTAGCVLVYAFRKDAIPVDTHVFKISNRLGWAKTKTPEQTEAILMKNIPKKYWQDVNELLVVHGQSICTPISPKCSECPIGKLCPRKGVKKSR